MSRIRITSNPTLNSSGLLAKGLTMSARETLVWDLADTTFGGSGTTGERRVYAQVRDAAGNWSPVFSDGIVWQ